MQVADSFPHNFLFFYLLGCDSYIFFDLITGGMTNI